MERIDPALASAAVRPQPSGAPHLRLLGVLAFVGVVTGLRDPVLLAALAPAVLVLVPAARLSWRFFLARLVPVLGGGGLFALLYLVGRAGDPRAVEEAGLLGLRLFASATVVIWLMGTLGERNLFLALSRLRLPPLFLCQLLFTWRYLHVLAGDLLSLRRAAAARGFVPGAGLGHGRTFSTLGRMAGACLLRSFARGDRVALAAAARGFGLRPPLAAGAGDGRRDLLPGLALAGLAAVLFWLDRGGLWPGLTFWR